MEYDKRLNFYCCLLQGNSDRTRSVNSLLLPDYKAISVHIIITVLNKIHRPVFCLIQDVSESVFCPNFRWNLLSWVQ
jgi:hypothetical protein